MDQGEREGTDPFDAFSPGPFYRSSKAAPTAWTPSLFFSIPPTLLYLNLLVFSLFVFGATGMLSLVGFSRGPLGIGNWEFQRVVIVQYVL
jgi:hypothetical protein